MATTLTYKRGSTLDTWLNTGSSLANNAAALSSAITITDTGHILADVKFNGTWGTAPTANTGLSCWLVREDGSGNYEDGDATPTTPARAPDFVIPVRAVNSAQVVVVQVVLPPGVFKMLVLNDGTGQTLNSGWTVKAIPYTYQNG